VTLRRKLADYLLRDERAAFRDATDALWELWERRPWLAQRIGPQLGGGLREALEEAARLGEVDQHLVDTLLRHARYVRLGAEGMGIPEESERLDAVAESRLLFRSDVLTQQIVALWTNFGFGQTITVEPEDMEATEAAEQEPEGKRAKEVWAEFWNARRNRPVLKDRRLHRLSDRLQVDGELFFAAFVNEGADTEDSPAGAVTLRTIPTEQITEMVTDPEDADVLLFYKREWTPSRETAPKTLYYPDWEATEDDLARAKLPSGAKRADEEKAGTGAYVLHAAYREIVGRGWPLQSAGAPWTRAYRDFLQDQTAVAAAVAMYVRKLKVQGGSRAVDAMRAQMESTLTRLNTWTETNPRAAAGSTFVENEAAELTNLPLRTGAADAAITSAALVGQVGLGGQVFPHWLGRGEAFRLATACYSSDTAYLGERGWKHFWEWCGERIATYNHEERRIEYREPKALYVYPYDGEMVSIKGRAVDALVTPNHRMLMLNENNVSREWAKTEFEVVQADGLPSRFALPTQALVEERPEIVSFTLPDYGAESGNPLLPYIGDRVLPMDTWLQFLGWWLAEGWQERDRRNESRTIGLAVSWKATGDMDAIRSILAKLPFRFYESEAKGVMRWRCHDHLLHLWLEENCGRGAAGKKIPRFAFGLNARQAGLLLDALWAGDGHREEEEHYRGFLTSVSKELLDGAQALMVHVGHWGGITVNREAGAHKLFPESLACWMLHRNERDKLSLSQKRNVSDVGYQGLVWCFEVPNGMFVTRRNGQPLIAGNSAMELPVFKAFRRYQLFWADVWRDLVDLVLTMKERYGGGKFETHHAQVSTDALADFDIKEMSTALVEIYDRGLVPAPEAMRIALTLLGVPNVDDVLDKAFPDGEGPTEREFTGPEARAVVEAAARVLGRT